MFDLIQAIFDDILSPRLAKLLFGTTDWRGLPFRKRAVLHVLVIVLTVLLVYLALWGGVKLASSIVSK